MIYSLFSLHVSKCSFLGWSNTGSMNNGRYYHTASVLTNGKVLVTGGYNGSIYLSSAQLYDPLTGTWTNTGNMNNARYDHAASVLTNGIVVLTGGTTTSDHSLNSTELY